MSEVSTDQVEQVRRIRQNLALLPGMILQGYDARQECAELAQELELVSTEPIGHLETAQLNLLVISGWPDGTYLGNGRAAINEVIRLLDLWIAAQPGNEPNPGVGRPCHLEPNIMQDLRDRQEGLVPTEAEIVRDAGDVGLRIQGGLREVARRTEAGVAGGDATSWVDID